MLYHRGMKVRLYPNKTQQNKIDTTINCCRYVYNEMLARNKKVYTRRGEHLNYYVMQNLLPVMKQYKPWLKDADSQALKYACRQVDTAYKKFFKKEAGFPKFHKKTGKLSYTTTNMSCVAFDKNKVKVPGLGWVKARGLRQLPTDAKLCDITISKEPDGTYYASICYKYDVEDPIVKYNTVIGLDYKSDGLYTDSNGDVEDMPHWFRESQTKLAKAQRKLSKRIGSRKGERKSYGWRKQYRKVSKIHKRISNQRKNYLHELSKHLAETYDIIAVEDLDMRNLSNKGFGNGKATMDNGYGMFVTMLDYKTKANGGQLIKVDRWYPSSQICSQCGNKQKIPLTTRIYRCPNCGFVLDRDHNAAINIKTQAIKMLAAQVI